MKRLVAVAAVAAALAVPIVMSAGAATTNVATHCVSVTGTLFDQHIDETECV